MVASSVSPRLTYKKLEKWPVVRGDDLRALDELTTFLVGCHNTLQDESGVSELDYPTSLRTIVNKLPVYLKDHWARIVDNIIYIHGDRITFKSLVDFLEKESRVALNPLFGRATCEVPHEKSKFQGKASGKEVTAAYISSAQDPAPKKDTPQLPRTDGYSKPCLLCDNDHPLSECRKFARQLLKERMAFLQRKRLCSAAFVPVTSKLTAQKGKLVINVRVITQLPFTDQHH